MKRLLLVALAALLMMPQPAICQKKAKIDKRAGYMEVPYFQNHDRGEKALDGHGYIQKVQDMGFGELFPTCFEKPSQHTEKQHVIRRVFGEDLEFIKLT